MVHSECAVLSYTALELLCPILTMADPVLLLMRPSSSAEYSVSPAHTAWHLADSTSYEDAATLPLAAMTAAIGLFRRLGLQEPPATGTGNAEGVVVVNGASSSVGAFVVQLAKRAGYTVVAIAGQSSDVPKELGADHIIDYRGKDSKALGKAVKDAVAQSGKKIVGVYDAVSTEATVETFAYEVLQPEGGQITTVLPSHENGDGLTVKNVKVIRTYVGHVVYHHFEYWATTTDITLFSQSRLEAPTRTRKTSAKSGSDRLENGLTEAHSRQTESNSCLMVSTLLMKVFTSSKTTKSMASSWFTESQTANA